MAPYDFGKSITVEDCQRISVYELIKQVGQSTDAVLGAAITVGCMTVRFTTTTTQFGGRRLWFLCPQCESGIGVLLAHPLTQAVGCRRCVEVEYRARRFKGMVENGFA